MGDPTKTRMTARLEELKISLMELAQATGESYRNVHRWVREDVRVPARFLTRFAEVVPVDPRWLLTGEGTPDPTRGSEAGERSISGTADPAGPARERTDVEEEGTPPGAGVPAFVLCPRRHTLAKVRLGASAMGPDGAPVVTVLECEHSALGPLTCDLECVQPSEAMESVPTGGSQIVSRDAKSRIRRAVEEQGLTYQCIADRIGVTPQAVSEIVNGRTKGASARYALAKVLDREVEDLWPKEV